MVNEISLLGYVRKSRPSRSLEGVWSDIVSDDLRFVGLLHRNPCPRTIEVDEESLGLDLISAQHNWGHYHAVTHPPVRADCVREHGESRRSIKEVDPYGDQYAIRLVPVVETQIGRVNDPVGERTEVPDPEIHWPF